MKNTNRCATCGNELPPTGGCRHCTREREAEGSAILLPLKGQRIPRTRGAHISTAVGVVIAVLTLCVGGAYAFHDDIADAIRGRRVKDPTSVSIEAQQVVEQTLKQAGVSGKASRTPHPRR